MSWFSDLDSNEKALWGASIVGIGLGVTGIAMGGTANARITTTNRRVTRLEGRVDQVESTCGISGAQSRAAADRAIERGRHDAEDIRSRFGGRGRGNF